MAFLQQSQALSRKSLHVFCITAFVLLRCLAFSTCEVMLKMYSIMQVCTTRKCVLLTLNSEVRHCFLITASFYAAAVLKTSFYSSRRRCLGTPRMFLFPSPSSSSPSVRCARSLQKGHFVIFFPFLHGCVCLLGMA